MPWVFVNCENEYEITDYSPSISFNSQILSSPSISFNSQFYLTVAMEMWTTNSETIPQQYYVTLWIVKMKLVLTPLFSVSIFVWNASNV